MQSSCSSLCKKYSTSAAHLFAAARFFAAVAGETTSRLGLAKPFRGLAKAFWVASLIVHPEL